VSELRAVAAVGTGLLPALHHGRARVAYDFHNHVENLAGYLESARSLGASVEIGNLLKTKQDVFSDPEAATAEYYELLRNSPRTTR